MHPVSRNERIFQYVLTLVLILVSYFPDKWCQRDHPILGIMLLLIGKLAENKINGTTAGCSTSSTIHFASFVSRLDKSTASRCDSLTIYSTQLTAFLICSVYTAPHNRSDNTHSSWRVSLPRATNELGLNSIASLLHSIEPQLLQNVINQVQHYSGPVSQWPGAILGHHLPTEASLAGSGQISKSPKFSAAKLP